jgi:CRISPR-associated endonuclease/helicase Cas3
MAKSFWLEQYSGQLVEEINEFAPEMKFTSKQLEAVDETLEKLLYKDKCHFNDWYKLRLKSSLLSTADRMEAMRVDRIHFNKPEIILSTEEYIKTLPETPLSEWRNEVRKNTLQNMKKITKPGIYKISLPTGAGKTLIALEIANRLNKKTIIYALPFISIIDQVSKVLQKLYKDVQEQHYLIEMIELEGNTHLSKFVNAFKYWFNPVIVTTFVSFWNTLFSPKYTNTMNFHRLKDSVVIMDEVQSIPSDYFSGFVKVLRKLCQKMNITVLMMTATMPGINRFKTLSEKQTFPHKRHQFLFSGEINEEDVLSNIDLSKSGMIVLNTKKLALKIYRELKNKCDNVYLLSKWIIPKERIKRIERLKTLENQKKNRTLVTTQLVEAGVDLDFQYILRDLAPLDSIVQAAGRCNRNLEQKGASVFLFKLKDDNNRSYSEYVYEKIKLNTTEKLLTPLLGTCFDEIKMESLLKSYYADVFNNINNRDIFESISSGEWGSYFPLIQRKFPEATLIVDTNGTMRPLLDEIMALPNKLETLDRKKQLWKLIQQYMINIPKTEAEEWYQTLSTGIIDDEEEEIIKLNDFLYYCSPAIIGKIYREDEGFIPLRFYEEEL